MRYLIGFITVLWLVGCRQEIPLPKKSEPQLTLADLKFDDFQKDALQRNGVVSDYIIYRNRQPKTWLEMMFIDSFKDGNKYYSQGSTPHEYGVSRHYYRHAKNGMLIYESSAACMSVSRTWMKHVFFPEARVLFAIQYQSSSWANYRLDSVQAHSITMYSFFENGKLCSVISLDDGYNEFDLTYYCYNHDWSIASTYTKKILPINSSQYQFIRGTVEDGLDLRLSNRSCYYYTANKLDSIISERTLINSGRHVERAYADETGLITSGVLDDTIAILHYFNHLPSEHELDITYSTASPNLNLHHH